MTVADDENIPDHINCMRAIIEQINTMKIHYFKISKITYAGILMQSLLASWDPFIDSLFRFNYHSDNDTIPKLSIVQFKRTLKDEYFRRLGHSDDRALLGITPHLALAVSKKASLANHLSSQRQTSNMYCNNCKKKNHTTDQCCHLGKPLCTNCSKFGHITADCWRDDKKKQGPSKGSKSGYSNEKDPCISKKSKFKKSNLAEEEESAMCIEDLDNNSTVNDPVSISDEDNLSIVGNPSNVEEAKVVVEKSSVVEDKNFNFYEPFDAEEVVHYFDESDNDMMCPMYVNCLADTDTTSHVFNECDLFTDYRPIDDTYVSGVRGTRTRTHGRGTVKVLAKTNSRQRMIKFKDALHIPECKHNLISLGRWEDSGRSY